MKIIYTAITNNYDTLLPQPDFPDIKYVVFTDNKELQSDQWEVRYIPNLYHKAPKMLSHKYLPKATQSLWIDGNVILSDCSIFDELRSDIATFKAEKRHTVREELEECIQLGYIPQENKLEEILQDYPDTFLSACTVILRNNHPSLKKFEKCWFDLLKYTTRDQITFPYALWKNKTNHNFIDGSIYENKYLNWQQLHG